MQACAPQDFNQRRTVLQALGSTLFLVTGRSDNNAKCQFPLFLRDHANWKSIPTVQKRGRRTTIIDRPIPRVLSTDTYMEITAALSSEHAARLLEEFVCFVLNTEQSTSQLWSVGRSYSMLKGFNRHKSLLTPLVIFQVRGSVTASGGHEPETNLRGRLQEWGLKSGVDFNTNDVVVSENLGTQRTKSRAYDFILPFRTPWWFSGFQHRLYIQCQFYAGDSGSVSHKNVDQTTATRRQTRTIAPDSRFLEYVDGAGYFSSLNGDLRKLLEMSDTGSFFQVRSAAIRLRRELQQVGFVTPLEVEHAIHRTGGDLAEVTAALMADGYEDARLKAAIRAFVEGGLIRVSASSRLSVRDDREDIVRRYLLLDTIARHGAPYMSQESLGGGSVLVPGYGPFFGLPMKDIVEKAIIEVPALESQFGASKVFMADLEWLCREGMAVAK